MTYPQKVALAVLALGILIGLLTAILVSTFGPSFPPHQPDSTPARLPVRNPAAESTLEKFEDLYLKATTVKLAYRWEFCGEGPAHSDQGTCLLKKGGKLRFSRTCGAPQGKADSDLTLISDGRSLYSSAHPITALELPQDPDRTIRLLVAREGPFGCVRLDPLLFPKPDRDKPSALYTTTVDEITSGLEEGGLKSVNYWLHFSEPKAGFDMELWYDPASYRIVRYYDRGPREITDCGSRTTLLECRIGDDIPDEQFVIPKKGD
jgi:hypothetical protein